MRTTTNVLLIDDLILFKCEQETHFKLGQVMFDNCWKIKSNFIPREKHFQMPHLLAIDD